MLWEFEVVPKRKLVPSVLIYTYAKFGEFLTSGRSLFWFSKFGRWKIFLNKKIQGPTCQSQVPLKRCQVAGLTCVPASRPCAGGPSTAAVVRHARRPVHLIPSRDCSGETPSCFDSSSHHLSASTPLPPTAFLSHVDLPGASHRSHTPASSSPPWAPPWPGVPLRPL
jgi:hypothetical protein